MLERSLETPPIVVEKENIYSEREIQVLQLLSDGLDNPKIGKKLGIASGTVKNSRESICKKTQDDNYLSGDEFEYAFLLCIAIRNSIQNGSVINNNDNELTRPLTPRETEVLVGVCSGLSNGQIGEKLVITSETARNHNALSFEKLGVRTRYAATAKFTAMKQL